MPPLSAHMLRRQLTLLQTLALGSEHHACID
jgi:hypothetical protein